MFWTYCFLAVNAFIILSILTTFYLMEINRRFRQTAPRTPDSPAVKYKDGILLIPASTFFYKVVRFTHCLDQYYLDDPSDWEQNPNLCPTARRFIYGLFIYSWLLFPAGWLISWPIRGIRYLQDKVQAIYQRDDEKLRRQQKLPLPPQPSLIKRVLFWVFIGWWFKPLIWLIIQFINFMDWRPIGAHLWGKKRENPLAMGFYFLIGFITIVYWNGIWMTIRWAMGVLPPTGTASAVGAGVSIAVFMITSVVFSCSAVGHWTKTPTGKIIKAWLKARHDLICPPIRFIKMNSPATT